MPWEVSPLRKDGRMKILKRSIIVFAVLVALSVCVFLIGRYGWKLFGFRFCDPAGIEAVEVDRDTVTIRGFYPGSFPRGFCGYNAREEDGTLSVGVRFSGIFGFFETGDFEISIPISDSVNEVILVTGSGSRVLWSDGE